MEPIFELAIELPRTGSRELLRTLHAQLRGAIVDGRLQPGVRLPPTRDLAATFGVSRNTAVAAYDLLLSEGYVEARQGDGTYVADMPSRTPIEPALSNSASGKRAASGGVRGDERLNAYWRDLHDLEDSPSRKSLRWDFQLGAPDKSLVPFDLWRRLSARALRTLAKQPLVEPEPHGRLKLREAIAQHASFTRAVACHADNITVTSGAQQAFDLLARVLVTSGKTVVATEDPGYPAMRAAFAAAGAKIAPVSVDDEGLIVDRLPKDTRIVCVTPSHQFPLGMAMSLKRRAELLAFAKARNAVVIEDDYDAEFRFGGRPLDALQTLDRGASVFYVGTFSKSLFPALRIGFVAAPAWARNALVVAKQVAVGHSAVLVQDTLAAFISEGHLARHVRKARRIYAARRDALLNRFENELGEWLEPIPSHAGLHLAAFTKGKLDADDIAQRAWSAGIGVYSLSRYYLGRASHTRSKGGLLFGYGAITETAIAEGLHRLNQLLRKSK
jgi:GntR family transcriptional regulator/MocR family aminotransferase